MMNMMTHRPPQLNPVMQMTVLAPPVSDALSSGADSLNAKVSSVVACTHVVPFPSIKWLMISI